VAGANGVICALGSGLTVIVPVTAAEQPAVVPVTVYGVVEAGLSTIYVFVLPVLQR
jgi:hypothetical protein